MERRVVLGGRPADDGATSYRRAVTDAESVREAPREERPRERLLLHGAQVLSDSELLAAALGGPTTGRDLARIDQLLAETGGLHALASVDLPLAAGKLLGRRRTAALAAAFEIGRRLARAEVPEREPLNRPEAVAAFLALRYARRDQEVMGALYLDSHHRFLADRAAYRGTISRAAVEPREVLKEAILIGASGVVLFHTHPSTDPSPSAEDLRFTRRMASAGELVGVRLVDHLVVGNGGRWVSLRQRGAF